MIKVKSNTPGICPICGAELDYGSMYPDNDGITYEWQCSKCGAQGRECYNVEFAGHYCVSSDNGFCDSVENELKK